MNNGNALEGHELYTPAENEMSYADLFAKAQSVHTAEEDLRRLARTEDLVKMSVAMNPKTPLDVLEDLAELDSLGVKKALLDNPSTPTHLRIMLIAEVAIAQEELWG